MGWFTDTVETIKEATAHEAIECPRGWGAVSFVGSAWWFPPMVGFERKCPIGGVESCSGCAYPSNPDTVRLGEQLAELDRLRSAGELSDEEARRRRSALLVLHTEKPGRSAYVAAWIMGPLGVLGTGAGVPLAIAFHPGFWVLGASGAIVLALSLSFFALARSAAREASERDG